MLRRHVPARLHMARALLLGAAGGPMFAHLALLGFAVTASVDRPKVEVWTNRRDDPYSSGQAVRVYCQTDRDGGAWGLSVHRKRRPDPGRPLRGAHRFGAADCAS